MLLYGTQRQSWDVGVPLWVYELVYGSVGKWVHAQPVTGAQTKCKYLQSGKQRGTGLQPHFMPLTNATMEMSLAMIDDLQLLHSTLQLPVEVSCAGCNKPTTWAVWVNKLITVNSYASQSYLFPSCPASFRAHIHCGCVPYIAHSGIGERSRAVFAFLEVL